MASSSTNQHNSSMMSKSKQNAEDTAGIEGNNVSQGDTIVHVNQKNNGASSGIFQSLTSMHQRPILHDANGQNLLKRLESGGSDNQLKKKKNETG